MHVICTIGNQLYSIGHERLVSEMNLQDIVVGCIVPLDIARWAFRRVTSRWVWTRQLQLHAVVWKIRRWVYEATMLRKKQLCYKSVQAKNHCAKTSLIPFLVYCHQRSFDYPQSIGCGKFAKCSTCPINLTSKQMEELNRLAVVILQTPSTGTTLYSNLKENKRR